MWAIPLGRGHVGKVPQGTGIWVYGFMVDISCWAHGLKVKKVWSSHIVLAFSIHFSHLTDHDSQFISREMIHLLQLIPGKVGNIGKPWVLLTVVWSEERKQRRQGTWQREGGGSSQRLRPSLILETRRPSVLETGVDGNSSADIRDLRGFKGLWPVLSWSAVVSLWANVAGLLYLRQGIGWLSTGFPLQMGSCTVLSWGEHPEHGLSCLLSVNTTFRKLGSQLPVLVLPIVHPCLPNLCSHR